MGRSTSGASSLYSQDEREKMPAQTNHRGARTAAGRSISYTPSYMSSVASRQSVSSSGLNLSNGANGDAGYSTASNKSIPTRHTQASSVSGASLSEQRVLHQAGVLLVLSPGSLHPLLTTHLTQSLKPQTYCAVAVVGSAAQEANIKQLKMDIYGLLGQLGTEAGVFTYLREDWSVSGMASTIETILKDCAANLHGVLLYPESAEVADDGDDILAADLKRSLQQTVVLVQDVAKVTAPQLLKSAASKPAANKIDEHTAKGPFLIIAEPSAPQSTYAIVIAAHDTLMQVLDISFRAKGLKIGYAESILAADPPQNDQANGDGQSLQSIPIPHSGQNVASQSALSESPTKLWGMWAQQDEFAPAS